MLFLFKIFNFFFDGKYKFLKYPDFIIAVPKPPVPPINSIFIFVCQFILLIVYLILFFYIIHVLPLSIT